MAKVEPKVEVEVEVSTSEAEEYYPCVYLSDIPLAVMKGLSVGDEVVVTLKGRVKSLAQREDYEDKEKINGNVDLEYNDITIKSGKKSEWAEMVDD